MNHEPVCAACGEPVKSSWKICPVCETPLGRRACPACGTAVKDGWKICPECSARLLCGGCGRRLPAGGAGCPVCGVSTGEAPGGGSPVLVEPVTGMEMVRVPAGAFQMGDLFGVGWDNETPVREVRVEAFYLGKFPVTQGQWQKVEWENPSAFPKSDMHPVEQVTWADVEDFIRRLNELTAGDAPFRLPSEAEWEYAARSGGRRELYAGGDDVDTVAWYGENSRGSTQPVGLKAANGLGIHDMSGNVWEWCRDVYSGSSAPETQRGRRPPRDGSARERVIRGGSWNLDAWSARCSRRFGFPEDYFGAGLGFRLARGT
jgi:formylglycine-generating enzyme required for sulfatase activity